MSNTGRINIQGMGDTDSNGYYYQKAIHDGYPYYENENGYQLIYRLEYMPYSIVPAYYIIKRVSSTNGYRTAAFSVAKYMSFSTNPIFANWINITSQYSGETSVGELDYMSSSSSSLSSLSSSSSSSLSSSSESSSSESSESSLSESSQSSMSSSSSSESSSSESSLSEQPGIGSMIIGSTFTIV